MTVTGFDGTTALGDSNSGYIVTIPSTYEGVPVTAIANGAFKGEESIVTVSIPSSVTVIGAEAFMDTINLTTVTIAPGGLSVIGRSAFENSGFTSIALPLEKLTDVQPYAFKSEKLQKFLNSEISRVGAETDEKIVYDVLENRMPILVTGASVKAWPNITPENQDEIRTAMQVLVNVIDPDKA